ncbi:putative disease resistance protein At5g47280 isoform X2 [Macadamia integrifolia]|uniref:putative disease resistance protein At5g47280 isoform X2 n=1 Tax=Macadamia integrifolia TaxID=60698 RepID=UPI001C52E5A3|nr:putative disease resistance protein At5g47280 isoform X2 [Macadamia integrifolia]
MEDVKIFADTARKVLQVISEMKDQNVNFGEGLKRLEDTLKQVVPLFEEGRILDLESNDRKQKGLEILIEKLRKGEELLQKCCKVESWNICLKNRYSRMIINLDEAIRRFCQRELQVEIRRQKKQKQRDRNRDREKFQELLLRREGMALQQALNVGLFAIPELPDSVVGFGIPLKELKIELFKENVTVLGLCAPGGCGKSTLAAMLCQDEQVRENPTTSKVLKRLLEEIGGGMPGSNLIEEDASDQFQFLRRQRDSEPMLLVLDNVWHESIIEMFLPRTQGYKMLVTSREIFGTYDSKYILKTLSHQDSMTLFCQTALSQGVNEAYEPDKDILNEIVRYCDGFPLTIMLIANSLSQQPAMNWRNMARKLSKGSSILDFDEKLRKYLASNLDSLGDTLREFFLDLGSFPKDEIIPASLLIDIWCELYELESEDAYVNLLNLASRNLVNLVGSWKIAMEIDANFNELFVSQHDLFRDLAIYMNRQERKRLIMDRREIGLPKSWRKQENHHLNTRLVSLCTGEMCSESWYDLQLPEAEVLILNFSACNYALPLFMRKMRKLKVLIIVNCGWTHAKLSNLKTVTEMANLKRIRLENVSIPSLREFTMPLMNLQKISLVMCAFGQALRKFTINVSSVLPNLVEVDISFCHDLVELPPWICDIINLRTLSITYCDNLSALPERIGFIRDLELLRLRACTGLLELPDSIFKLRKLRFLDISDCCDLKMLPDLMGELHCLKKLDMGGCLDLRTLPPSTMNLVHLKEVICDEEAASLWEPLSSRMKITFLRKEHNLDWLGVDIGHLS